MSSNTSMNLLKNTIILDGGASTGKTSVGEILASSLGYAFCDSGSIYRAFCYHLLCESTQILPRHVFLALQTFKPELSAFGDVILNGIELTHTQLHCPDVTQLVPLVGSAFFVRKQINSVLRELAEQNSGDAVFTGRDLGAVVFPESKYKFFLQASPEIRAKRRYEQMISSGYSVTYDEIFRSVLARDQRDSTRQVSPMNIASDAILIDTSDLTLEEVLTAVRFEVEQRQCSLEGGYSRGKEC